MIAFLIYGSPPAVVAGALALWRVGKTEGALRKAAMVAAALGLAFPVLTVMVMLLRT